MERWLGPALAYIPSWLDFQVRQSQQPGCLLAIVHRGKVVLETACGAANTTTGQPLTPRHRFRIASHSKTFTAAGILKLREQKKLRLDDEVGAYIPGLHKKAAQATLAQILSHGAGLVRDGTDGGQFAGTRPFATAEQILEALKSAPIIDAGTRLKYSNHGFSLLGMVIGAVTGESYNAWIEREIVQAAGLKETRPDMPLPRGTPFARGHSAVLPLGRRLVFPGNERTNAVASAGGFVSTAADTARFFNQLAPGAAKSVLSPASRREMVRPVWRNPHAALESYYGLGTMSGTTGGWSWFGHGGALLGYISRTVTLPAQELTISIFTNATDGWAGLWVDGAMAILRTFAQNGPPTRKVAGWTGRWWSVWGAFDLVPMGSKVLAAAPGWVNPFFEPSEITVTGRDTGTITQAAGYGAQGEPVRRTRSPGGRVVEVRLGAGRAAPEARAMANMVRRFDPPKPKKRSKRRRSR
jgi:CubicO group peptidase (beta-lactamase class C family)